MKKILLVFLASAFMLYFYSCTHKPGVVPKVTTPVVTPKDSTKTTDTTNAVDTTHQQVEDTSVCFQRDILPIFQGSCGISGCHNASTKAKGYNLTTYAGIVAKGIFPYHPASSGLYTECTSGKMPKSPTPKLTSAQLTMIAIWISKGAPNDTNCAIICDTTKFTYTNAIVPIFTNYCYSCHAASSAPKQGGGFVLDNYNGVHAQVLNGKLMGDLQHSTGFNYMPLGGMKLSDCKITQVKKWIDAGAQNN